MLNIMVDNLSNSIVFQTMMKSAILLGVSAGLLGVFLSYKRKSIEINVFSSGSFVGILLMFIIFNTRNQFYTFAGAVIAGVISSLILRSLYSSVRINRHITQSLLTAIFLGVGITLITYITQSGGGRNSGLEIFLFGESTSLMENEYDILRVVTSISIALIVLLYPKLKLVIFNEELAQSYGRFTEKYNIIINIMAIILVASGIKIMGIFFIICIFLIPAMTARLISKRFGNIVLLSAIIGGISGGIGALIAGSSDEISTGVAITLVASFLFFITVILSYICRIISAKLRGKRV